MPRVMGGARSTYLLLSGIRVPRAVKLSEGIDLLPIDEDAEPRPYLAGLELMDKQFALLLLPWVQSQLRVKGSGKADIAMRAWNAMWDVLLLSAIYNVPVNCGLQSSTEFERFTEKSRLNVIHYRVYDPPPGDGLLLTEKDCTWLEAKFEHAQDLMEEERFRTAVHCLSTYAWHSLPRAQLALIWAGIESLFDVDSELSFRVSLYAAKFLDGTTEAQRDTFAAVRRLYGDRSKAVHGGKLKGNTRQSVDSSASLLSRLVRACIELKQVPNTATLVP